jgi:YesN/AraC family two-component response regulator
MYQNNVLTQNNKAPGEISFFSICSFPCYEAGAEDQTTPHCHSHFQFLWIEKGKGLLYVDTDSIPVEEGTVCFTRPGQMHQLIETEAMEGYALSFSEDFLHSGETEFSLFYHESQFHVFECATLLSDETNNVIKDLIDKMSRESHKPTICGEDFLRRYFKIFLLYLFREFESKNNLETMMKPNLLVQRFLHLVNEQFIEKKMVSDYANQLYVTPNYLNEITKQITGHTAGYHIKQRILIEIQRKAIYTTANMKEIAYSLGFIDPAHFSKYFKNIAGINFTEYKARLKVTT